jgi:glycosyltransferase involved in cell wall biosynthesis
VEWWFTAMINSSDIFKTNSSHFGGTEYMLMNAKMKFLDSMDKLNNYHCVILPGYVDAGKILNDDKKVILWAHCNLYQFGGLTPDTQIFLDLLLFDKYKNKLKAILVVSETQKKIMIEQYPKTEGKVFVVENAIHPLNYNKNKFKNFDKPNLIYASGKDRGLSILLKSLKYIDSDFSLKVFTDFDPIKDYEEQYIEAILDERVTFYNFVPRKTVKKYIEESHIHAYPSKFHETFCLSQAEAMSAGLLCVYGFDKYNAIKEISGDFGIGIDFDSYPPMTEETASKIYSKSLENAIQLIKNKKFNPKKQIEYINDRYSWENAEKQWRELYETL